MYPYVTRVYPYVTRIYSYVTRMYPYVTRIYSYVSVCIRMLLVCIRMLLVYIRMLLVCIRMMLPIVLEWCFSHDPAHASYTHIFKTFLPRIFVPVGKWSTFRNFNNFLIFRRKLYPQISVDYLFPFRKVRILGLHRKRP